MIDPNRGDNLKCQVTIEGNSDLKENQSLDRVPDRN